MTRRVLLAVTALGVVAAALGFALDASAFAANLLAGIAGGCASLVVAVTLVERLLARERGRQWADVREQLRRSVIVTGGDVAFELQLSTLPKLPVGLKEAPYMATGGGPASAAKIARVLDYLAIDIEARLDELSQVKQSTIYIQESDGAMRLHRQGSQNYQVRVSNEVDARLTMREELDRASSRLLHSAVTPLLNELRASHARLLQLQGSPALAIALGEVEQAEREWRQWVATIDDWGAPENIAWTQAARTARAVARAVRAA